MRETSSPSVTTRTGTTTATNHDSPTSSRTAMTMPPMPRIGAVIIIVKAVMASIWTCWTSLVFRVMSEGAPNRAISRAENPFTWSNTWARMSRPAPIAVRAAKRTAAMVVLICSSDTASITAPTRKM